MARFDPVRTIFDEADTNRDGSIDKKEMRNWISNRSGLTSPTHESSSYGHDLKDNTSRRDGYKYQETIGVRSTISDTVINTNSSEETKRYLERSGINVYIDPNPQIIRRATTERPLSFEQRVLIRCLQPPALPPAEPLIIKEVRPEQPSPPPPLIIREQTSYATSPPPIILRERPPTPPARLKSETTTRYLPPIPVPPRSLVIERLPPAPEKPRDIIIERWLPYGHQAERRTIVQPAPAPIQYPAPSHTIIEYDGAQSNINRKFERLGVDREDPDAYISRYGTSLLDSSTLIQQARKLGVTEDISCPLRLASLNTITHEKSADLDRSIDMSNQGYSSAVGYGYEKTKRTGGTEVTNISSNTYSSSTSRCVDDNARTANIRDSQSGYHGGDVTRTVTHLKRDSELI